MKTDLQKRLTPPKHTNQPNYLLDLKGWLIFFNLAADQLLSDISWPRWKCSLQWKPGLQTLERHVLALEDRHYFGHHGVDFRCLWRICKQVAGGKKVGGVSTIEQQYVRTFLNRRDRTFGRKFNEVILASVVGHRAQKLDTLRAYLGCAYFGYRLNGCDSASELIFGKKADELGESESAFLASLLVYPLPRLVRSQKHLFPVSDINNFLQLANITAPNWATAIGRRLAYAMSLRHNS